MTDQKAVEELLSDIDTGPGIYNAVPQENRVLRKIDNVLILPIEGETYFPYMHVMIHVDIPELRNAVMESVRLREPIFIVNLPELTNSQSSEEQPQDDLAILEGMQGSVGLVKEVKRDDNGVSFKVFFVTGYQATLTDIYECSGGADGDIPLLRGNVVETPLTYINPNPEVETEIRNLVKEKFNQCNSFLPDEQIEKLKETLNAAEPTSLRYLHIMLQNTFMTNNERQELLDLTNLEDRREHFLRIIERTSKRIAVREEIARRTSEEFGHRQREEFIRQQIRTMQDELGDAADDDEIAALKERASKKNWTEEMAAIFEKELRKLSRYNPTSPEYAVQYTWIDNFLSLPWLNYDDTEIDLGKVEEVLERDHYGLEKVKDRIIEQMAVMKLRKDMKAPAICLYGPPGVGKTSIGKSIAEALGRKYARVALGGVHDEAEIRGHRRTYLGAMPGRIMAALEKCESGNPVIVLDEIDKIGKGIKGDPSTALLEVLDPEQNCRFHDNFIDHDYDLSKILFIATANDLSGISAPLLDRLELIEMGSYVDEEKIEIALRHLLPKSLEEHGIPDTDLRFEREGVQEIISRYTRESGVRQLKRKIDELIRKIARRKATGQEFPNLIEAKTVRELLGRPEVDPDEYEGNDFPGVVTGLAWTRVGGDILYIESSLAPGKGDKLTLTGNLGDVMKESAMIAMQYLKSNADSLGIPAEKFSKYDVHIHVPEGAVPKDGPSAGITMLTSLASSFTGRKVKERLAMTGEFTLRGRVLPVGGIKEKILAAKKAGIREVILSSKNRKDIEDIKQDYLEGMEFHFVDNASEVLDLALLPLER